MNKEFFDKATAEMKYLLQLKTTNDRTRKMRIETLGLADAEFLDNYYNKMILKKAQDIVTACFEDTAAADGQPDEIRK